MFQLEQKIQLNKLLLIFTIVCSLNVMYHYTSKMIYIYSYVDKLKSDVH